jgi:hypothetical protein
MFTRWYTSMLLFCLFGCSIARAQVTIENPKNLSVDEKRVNLLFNMACQEIAHLFHVHDERQLEAPLTLILGQDDEQYVIDSRTQTIYLKEWNEPHFVGSVVRLAIQRLLSTEQFRKVVNRTLERYSDASPITVTEARKRR